MYVIVTCKCKNYCFPNYKSMEIFSDAQGHLTQPSVVRSGRTSNSFELSCMSSLPTNKNIIMSSFKSSGDIQKKEGGPDSCFG